MNSPLFFKNWKSPMNRTLQSTALSFIIIMVLFVATKELFADVSLAELDEVSVVPETMPETDDMKDADRFLINEVAALVDGPERRFYVTKLDLEIPGFDGKIPSLDTIVDEELIYQDAQRHKIPITEYAQKHIQSIKKQHKLSDEAFTKICAEAGLDQAAALEKFEKIGAANTMIQHKADSFIAEHEVKAYYEANPVHKSAKYQIQVNFVPFDPNKSVEQQKQDLEATLRVNANALHWNEPFWLKEQDLAQEKMFITQMKPGDIATEMIEGGFEVLRLKDKREPHLVPLEKRYGEIVHILRMPKVEKTIETYKKALHESSSIVDLREPQSSQHDCS